MLDILAVNWNVDPVIFSIGIIKIKYYSILFVCGIFPIGYYIVRSMYKKEGVPLDKLDPLLYAILLGTVVGARLGHCFFYDPQYYLVHPLEILETWKGGLASHGGAIGVLIAVWWYVHRYGKKYGFDALWILDRVAIAAAFAGAMIRLGNLFNSEIYGMATDLPWGFVFLRNGETIAKHPTQLYESLAYLLIGILLLVLYRKQLKKIHRGFFIGVFFILVFLARFFIEFVKNPQSNFEVGMSLNMGQILSIPFIMVGIILLVISFKWTKPAERTLAVIEPKNKVKNQKVELTHVHSKSNQPNDYK
ncbi:MAG: prolipoprotein diacylglyceryl transferase [Bacteroidales bacterium]